MVEWFGRPEIETDEAREHRITMEAVVDAYNEEKRAIGWYFICETDGASPVPGERRTGQRAAAGRSRYAGTR